MPVQITSDLGSGSTALAQQTVTFKAKRILYATTLTVQLNNLKLDSGTYYLVLSTRSDPSVGYVAWNSGPEIDSTYGYVGSAFYSNPTGYTNPNEANFVPATFAPQVLQFQLLGKPR